MTETKHTPGPWEISEDLGMDEAWCNWHSVGPIDLMGSKANADSRLIAAAPDLLEALKILLADIEDYQRINKLGGENNHSQVISRAAIDKAEGRS